ncbi:MAG: chromate transporter [Acholeplasmataceae bacterium]
MLEILTLFWIFFKIGLFTFGGGYAMIPLIQTEMVDGGYIEYDLMIDFIGISESTPGPLAVNMATFIGMNQFGIIGAFATTLGVVLPSFIIISLIAAYGSKALESSWFKRAFLGLRPVVIGLIIGVAITLAIRSFFPNMILNERVFDPSSFRIEGLIVLTIIALLKSIGRISPIRLILIAATLGILINLISPF